VTALDAEQSVLSGPIYSGIIAKYGHCSRISAQSERNFSAAQTEWRSGQSHANLSPAKFPANREKYREFAKFPASKSQSCCVTCRFFWRITAMIRNRIRELSAPIRELSSLMRSVTGKKSRLIVPRFPQKFFSLGLCNTKVQINCDAPIYTVPDGPISLPIAFVLNERSD
jgi:hypothetical protein